MGLMCTCVCTVWIEVFHHIVFDEFHVFEVFDADDMLDSEQCSVWCITTHPLNRNIDLINQSKWHSFRV